MSNGLSQAEIDALLQGGAGEPEAEDKPKSKAKRKSEKPPAPQADDAGAEQLSTQQIDAMGEIGNISMGTSATTLSSILSRRVDITTPKVTVTSMREIAREYPLPFVAVQVQYTQGLEGTNILFLKVDDVKIITDLMMGGDGTNTAAELGDLHLSAISEAMNQMVGSSSTAMAKLLGMSIDIAPPISYAVNLAEDVTQAPFSNDEPLARTSFQMEVEGLIQSEIMQVMPVGFARQMVERMLGGAAMAAVEVNLPTHEEAIQQARKAPQTAPPATLSGLATQAGQPQAAEAQTAFTPQPSPSQPPAAVSQRTVEVRPAQFDSFGQSGQIQGLDENMGLLMDVPLPVSVELGKSKKYIKEILDFNVGSIIVLDKMAGDMVDVVVNGKLIAKAEVVVIDDSYGARITDIVTPAKRLNNA